MKEQNPTDQVIPTRRKRGGQPGNRNAVGNRGNQRARGVIGNRGGCGAPFGNENARKKRNLETDLRRDYAANSEALAWIEAKQNDLQRAELRSDTVLDQAMYMGLPLDDEILSKFSGKFAPPLQNPDSMFEC